LDPAASQYADPDLAGEPEKSTMDLGSTAYLLSLKGSLVSVLSYSDTSELYTTLMVRYPQDPLDRMTLIFLLAMHMHVSCGAVG
jgi:hypothetical protein